MQSMVYLNLSNNYLTGVHWVAFDTGYKHAIPLCYLLIAHTPT